MTRSMTICVLAVMLLGPVIAICMYGGWAYYPNRLYFQLRQYWPAVMLSEAVIALVLLFILPPILRLRWKPMKGAQVEKAA
jgi:hypothetical protein